ncbi:MAG: hypothetical protein V1847_05365 [Candidatus Diapherotrites archaeon]
MQKLKFEQTPFYAGNMIVSLLLTCRDAKIEQPNIQAVGLRLKAKNAQTGEQVSQMEIYLGKSKGKKFAIFDGPGIEGNAWKSANVLLTNHALDYAQHQKIRLIAGYGSASKEMKKFLEKQSAKRGLEFSAFPVRNARDYVQIVMRRKDKPSKPKPAKRLNTRKGF